MSLAVAISSICNSINEGKLDIMAEIDNVRHILIDDSSISLNTYQVREQILQLWNYVVTLTQRLTKYSSPDQETLRIHVLPSIRLLVVDTLEKYETDDAETIFVCLVNTYKCLIDAENPIAELIFQKAVRFYPKIPKTTKNTQLIVQLYIWNSKMKLEMGSSDDALKILRFFRENYNIESSVMISYASNVAIGLKSIDWCKFCLEIVESNEALLEEWKDDLMTMLTNLYLNNGEMENAKIIIPSLKPTLNAKFLELKCMIKLDPKNSELEKNIIEFVHLASQNKVLGAMSNFIKDNSIHISNVAMAFFNEVINTQEQIDKSLLGCIAVNAIETACLLDDVSSAMIFLKKIRLLDIEERKNAAILMWNKSLDTFENKEFSVSAQWMQQTRILFNENDKESQSSCFRFIARCMLANNEPENAIQFINEAINYDESCYFNYILKYQILVQKNFEEAKDFIEQLDNSHIIADFDFHFYSSMATELYQAGDHVASINFLLKSFKFSENITNTLLKSTIHSLFSILQNIEDMEIRSKCINQIRNIWNDKLKFSVEEQCAFSSIAYDTGIHYFDKNEMQKAASIFEAGVLFSIDAPEYLISCASESINSYLKAKNIAKAKEIYSKISSIANQDDLLIIEIEISCFEGNDITPLLQKVNNVNVIKQVLDFICPNYSTPRSIDGLLCRAQELNASQDVIIGIYHELIQRSKSIYELKSTYELILDAIDHNNNVSYECIQYLMSTAWNIGVQNVKSRRSKDGKWWLQTALKILEKNEDLINIYKTDLEGRYSAFLDKDIPISLLGT